MDGSKNENISVSGSTFHYFKDRLNGGKVFANQEKSRYLRTANASEIADEITLTRNLYQRGFPVPEVVATGALESGTAITSRSRLATESLAMSSGRRPSPGGTLAMHRSMNLSM